MSMTITNVAFLFLLSCDTVDLPGTSKAFVEVCTLRAMEATRRREDYLFFNLIFSIY